MIVGEAKTRITSSGENGNLTGFSNTRLPGDFRDDHVSVNDMAADIDLLLADRAAREITLFDLKRNYHDAEMENTFLIAKVGEILDFACSTTPSEVAMKRVVALASETLAVVTVEEDDERSRLSSLIDQHRKREEHNELCAAIDLYRNVPSFEMWNVFEICDELDEVNKLPEGVAAILDEVNDAMPEYKGNGAEYIDRIAAAIGYQTQEGGKGA